MNVVFNIFKIKSEYKHRNIAKNKRLEAKTIPFRDSMTVIKGNTIQMYT